MMNNRAYLAGVSVLALAIVSPAVAWSATSDLVLWAENGTNIQQSRLIQKFEAQYPQYKVRLTEYPWQVAHDKLVAAMASDQAPDVSLGEDQWVGEFAHLGLLEPLDDFKKQQNYQDKDFLPNSWSYYVESDGKTYAAPSYTEARALFYRTDIFKAANIDGPPKTLDEMRALGKKLSNGQNRFGLADQSGDLDLHFFSWFLYANGGDVYDFDALKMHFGRTQSD